MLDLRPINKLLSKMAIQKGGLRSGWYRTNPKNPHDEGSQGGTRAGVEPEPTGEKTRKKLVAPVHRYRIMRLPPPEGKTVGRVVRGGRGMPWAPVTGKIAAEHVAVSGAARGLARGAVRGIAALEVGAQIDTRKLLGIDQGAEQPKPMPISTSCNT